MKVNVMRLCAPALPSRARCRRQDQLKLFGILSEAEERARMSQLRRIRSQGKREDAGGARGSQSIHGSIDPQSAAAAAAAMSSCQSC